MAASTNAPRQEFGQNYAQRMAGAYTPRIQGLSNYIQSLNARQASVPTAVSDLFGGAVQQAGQVGSNVANTGANFMAALSGLGGGLPGEGAAAHEDLAMAARQAARGGATAEMLGSVLGTQVSQERANAILQAQDRISQQQAAANEALWGAQEEQSKTALDWMTPAAARQQLSAGALANEGARISNQAARMQLKGIPLTLASQKLDNMLKRGQITQQQYDNLAAEYKLKSVGVKSGSKPSSTGGDQQITPTIPVKTGDRNGPPAGSGAMYERRGSWQYMGKGRGWVKS